MIITIATTTSSTMYQLRLLLNCMPKIVGEGT